MSFVPSSAATNTASLAASNLANLAAPNTAWQSSIGGGNLGPAAMIDAILSSVGYQALNDATGLGSIPGGYSTTSFNDVGNGSTTGFSSWTTPSITVAKTYLIWCRLSCYVTVGGGRVFFQLVVDGTAPGSQPTSAQRIYLNTTNQQFPMFFAVPVALSAGTHVVKLQWKVDSGVTAQVDTNDGRTFWITG